MAGEAIRIRGKYTITTLYAQTVCSSRAVKNLQEKIKKEKETKKRFADIGRRRTIKSDLLSVSRPPELPIYGAFWGYFLLPDIFLIYVFFLRAEGTVHYFLFFLSLCFCFSLEFSLGYQFIFLFSFFRISLLIPLQQELT